MIPAARLLGLFLGLSVVALVACVTFGPPPFVAPRAQVPVGLLWWPTGALLAALQTGNVPLVLLALGLDGYFHLGPATSPAAAFLHACWDAAPAYAISLGLGRLGLRADVTRLYDVLLLALLGAGGMGVGAGGVAWLLGTRGPEALRFVYLHVALAHAASVLLVTPALLVWTRGRRRMRLSWPKGVEFAALLGVLLFVAAHLAPLHSQSPLSEAPPAIFLFLPAFLWAATRFGQRGAVTSLACLSLFTLTLRWLRHGSLLGGGMASAHAARYGLEGLVAAQSYFCLALLCVLIFGSVIEERREAIRLRDDFLLIASHELKTPLTALMLGVENLERRLQREQGQNLDAYNHKLSICHAQIDRLARLVDGLLDVARISGRSLHLRRQYQDLSTVVTGAVESMQPLVAQTQCRVDCSLGTDAWGYYDEHRVVQLMRVLLENACKYGAGKPIAVELTTSAQEVKIVVQDNGIGVAPADARRIFRRFERAVSSHSYGGLGLGLFVAHKIAAAHGGELSVDPSCNDGARFVTRLPRRHGLWARWLYDPPARWLPRLDSNQ